MPYGWSQVIQNYMQSKQMKAMREQLDMQREALKQEKDKIAMAQERHDLDMDIAFSPIVQATTGEEATAEQIAEARKTGAVTVQHEEVTRAAQSERPAPAAVRGGKPASMTLPATKAETEIIETKKPLIFSFGEKGATIDMTPEKAASWAETVYTGLTPRFIMDTAKMFEDVEPEKFFAAIARANSEVIDMFNVIASGEGKQIDPTMYSLTLTRAIISEAKGVAGITEFMGEITGAQQKKFDAAMKEGVSRYSQLVTDSPTLDATGKGLVLRALNDVDSVSTYQRLQSNMVEFETTKLAEMRTEAESRARTLSADAEIMGLFYFLNDKGWGFESIADMQEWITIAGIRLKSYK